MLNIIWLFLLVASTVTALITGNLKNLVNSVPDSAMNAFKLSIGLTGVMALWLGIMKIAEVSGLTNRLSSLIAANYGAPIPWCAEGSPCHSRDGRQHDRQHVWLEQCSDSSGHQGHEGSRLS